MDILLADNYCRAARYESHYDGDTVTLTLDLGYHTTHTSPFRVLGIDTPELRGSERLDGILAKDFVGQWMFAAGAVDAQGLAVRSGWPLVVRSVKAGKYGRWLGEIWTADGEFSLSESLLTAGHAVPYDGGKRG